jgi:3-oxoacyl-(acyl-carrier-protein) synthase
MNSLSRRAPPSPFDTLKAGAGSTAIVVAGLGAVSPAGWGLKSLQTAWASGEGLPTKELARPGWTQTLQVRPVPPPPARSPHARLRRASAVSQYLVEAALEALGVCDVAAAPGAAAGRRLGIVTCVMSGCVNYSRRFYDEAVRDPATASPLLFPETVFNAPSSHLAAVLGATGLNYTLVGDPASFPLGLALAKQWLQAGLVDECLVAGAEELDWLTADAFRLFAREVVVSEGAGALHLKAAAVSCGLPLLKAVTMPEMFWNRLTRRQAATKMRSQLGRGSHDVCLYDGRQRVPRLDEAESEAWQDWKGERCSPKVVFGEGLMAASAWQCVLAADAVQRRACRDAVVSVIGCNAQAAGCRFSNA